MRFFLLLLLLPAIGFGCKKIKGSRFEGVYECDYHSHSSFMGVVTDTSYTTDVTVNFNGQDLIIGFQAGGMTIPVKELDKDNCFKEWSSQSYRNICFGRNSIECSWGYDYQNSSADVTYSGTRKK